VHRLPSKIVPAETLSESGEFRVIHSSTGTMVVKMPRKSNANLFDRDESKESLCEFPFVS